MLHPYNNGTKKLLSLGASCCFYCNFTRFISTSLSVSVAKPCDRNSLIKAASRPLFACARRFAP